jgi:transcriptional regulator with XRE-family HTH domain
MADAEAGSTVPRRQLGRYLRDLRVAAGLTARAAARELERSDPTLWRIENGHTATRSLDVEQMCRLYGATPEMTKSDVAPGIFQTEDYARTLIRFDNPDREDGEIDRRVQLRLGRQAILRRPIDPPLVRVTLREAALRCHVGGADIMTAQLGRLAEVSELPNVSLRIIPFRAGLHPGVLSGSFEVLRFPMNGGGVESEPPTVYADLFSGALYLDKPHEVGRYDRAFGEIWEASLDEEASRDLLRKTAEEL